MEIAGCPESPGAAFRPDACLPLAESKEGLVPSPRFGRFWETPQEPKVRLSSVLVPPGGMGNIPRNPCCALSPDS
jgi:hypothetical protein